MLSSPKWVSGLGLHNVSIRRELCILKLKQPDPEEVVEKTNDLNAPLMPANDDTGFRPLTEEEKENFMALDAKGRQMLADLESLPKPVWLRHD
jgi:hypothetical protein